MSDRTEDDKWALTEYEEQRKPQPVITDSTPIAVSAHSLLNDFTCPICMSLMVQPMVGKECRHRFCYECIVSALRTCNKECPTCRAKTVSKRNFLPDTVFEALIEKIFPNGDNFGDNTIEIMARQKTFRENTKTLVQRKEELSKGKSKKGQPAAAESSVQFADQVETEAAANQISNGEPIECELTIKPIPSTDSERHPDRYLKMSAIATMEHIAKYLKMRYDLANVSVSDEFEVPDLPSSSDASESSPLTMYRAAKRGQFDPLPRTMSLEEFAEQFANGENRSMELYCDFTVLEKADH